MNSYHRYTTRGETPDCILYNFNSHPLQLLPPPRNDQNCIVTNRIHLTLDVEFIILNEIMHF